MAKRPIPTMLDELAPAPTPEQLRKLPPAKMPFLSSGPGRGFQNIHRDRGSNRGAKRCIVTADLQLIDQTTAKQAGIQGVFFQSRKEAKFYIGFEQVRRAGRLRPLPGRDRWRQVPFPLFATNPAGLKVQITKLVLDFAYEIQDGDRWVACYQDVKPGGGHREDLYLMKKKWLEAQYGLEIVEL